MGEYQYILSLYKKRKRYLPHLVLFSLAMLALASLIVMLNIVRINPFVIFMIAMAGTLYYARYSRVESKNYQKLRAFLNEQDSETLNNEELVFFIDYQMNSYFKQETEELIKRLNDSADWNDEKAGAGLKEIVTEIKSYYEYLAVDSDLDDNMEISLKWYRESIENRKKDLV